MILTNLSMYWRVFADNEKKKVRAIPSIQLIQHSNSIMWKVYYDNKSPGTNGVVNWPGPLTSIHRQTIVSFAEQEVVSHYNMAEYEEAIFIQVYKLFASSDSDGGARVGELRLEFSKNAPGFSWMGSYSIDHKAPSECRSHADIGVLKEELINDAMASHDHYVIQIVDD